MFDDYNYKPFNRYILVDPNYSQNSDEDVFSESEEGSPEPMTPSPEVHPHAHRHEGEFADVQDCAHNKKLTDKVLDQSVQDSYQHSQLDVETE